MFHVKAASTFDFGWLATRAHCLITGDFKAIKVVDEEDSSIVGMVGYCNWKPNSVEAHIAVDKPIAWRALKGPAFTYPFIQAGRKIIFGVCTSDNKKSLRIIRHLGFRETHRVKDGWSDGIDMVLHEIRKEEWHG